MSGLISKALDWLFKPDSFWRNAALYALCCLIALSIPPMFAELRPIAAFAESFVAHLVFFGSMIASGVAGVFVGGKLRAKSWPLRWIAGLCIFFAVGVGILVIGSQIPGVGWRIERLASSGNE